MQQFKNRRPSNEHLSYALRCLFFIIGILLWQASYAQNSTESSVDNVAERSESISTASASGSGVSPSDQLIKQRLEGIYSELQPLNNVQVSVSNSVVTLSGELLSTSAIDDANALASKVEGVVEVDSQLTITTAVSERLDNSIDELSKDSRRFFSNLPIVVLATAIVIAGWFLGRYVASIRSLFNKIAPNRFIAELIGNIVWIVIFFIGLYIGLRLLDATELIGTVLGAAGIVGLALGFAVKDTVENYIASILLSIRHPFKTKDYVSIDGIEGSVARLTSRATILVSSEGNHIRIPNAVVYKSTITNYSRNPLRRFEFTVGIDRSDDILLAQTLAIDLIANVSGVLAEPGCTVTVDKLGESNTTLLIRAWVNQTSHDLLKVKSETIRQLKIGFDDANIVMPEPIYKLKISNEAQSLNTQENATSKSVSPISNHKAALRKSKASDAPAQSVAAENMIDSAIDAELAISEENLLSDHAAEE